MYLMQSKKMRKFFSLQGLIWIFLSSLVACQSSPLNRFGDLKKGMEKVQVVDLLGSPKSTQRWQGKDRWLYEFTTSERLVEKEVHFQDGQLVYAGNPVRPLVSAADQDRINDKQNVEVEKLQGIRGVNAPPKPANSGGTGGGVSVSPANGGNSK